MARIDGLESVDWDPLSLVVTVDTLRIPIAIVERLR